MFTEVCKDLDGESPWFYDDINQKYLRCKPDGTPDMAGKLTAHLYGRDIPDVHALWKKRLKQLEVAVANGVKLSPEHFKRAKPSDTTFKLFDHWQGVENGQP